MDDFEFNFRMQLLSQLDVIVADRKFDVTGKGI